jgi:uncharacterized SAM-binding protein YcdF (DUF218 family)
MEGIRLLNKSTRGILVLSGAGWEGRATQDKVGELMKETALDLGVQEKRILLEISSRDTREQAHILQTLLDKKPFVLVTSAFHMSRAVLLFRQKGLEPIPAPCDFRSLRKKPYSAFDFVPTPGRFLESFLAVKEYYGLVYYRLFK